MGNLQLLKSERVKYAKTQSDMAQLIKCSVPSYNQKENGKRKFSQDEISAIVDALNLSGDMIKDIFFTG